MGGGGGGESTSGTRVRNLSYKDDDGGPPGSLPRQRSRTGQRPLQPSSSSLCVQQQADFFNRVAAYNAPLHRSRRKTRRAEAKAKGEKIRRKGGRREENSGGNI